ncbi:hypothetical protein [Streptomyces sp. NBC_01089]|uniref:hypothetical protein n=1 Tax=Streptomyces sp. NBC_01089 TaxID=2903747 RepID=UPI0038630FC7|nr:hypothetical protein OG510_00135 [Streptomyces sp. NBC_01089]WSU46407.1 hypothetical protein OG510_37015 [Streptomyces sp. NBC_01089]
MIDRLELPSTLSIEILCRHIAARRGRPLHLHPLPREAATAGACGMWLATDAEDHIFYEQRTALLHQEHIVLHEIGHMLFDHGASDEDGTGWGSFLPDLDVNAVQRLLRRTNYATSQEREAELFASVLGTLVCKTSRRHADGALGRLEAALGVNPRHGTA